jgi:phosphopantetheinyl transferase (holo-ACP synthase)
LISAGNDIVALNRIDPGRSQFPGFYTKVLTPSEQALFYKHTPGGSSGPLPFEHFLWLLWSVKESVYKYAKQTTPDLIFSPTRIVTQRVNAAAQPTEAPALPQGKARFFTTQVQTGTGTFHTRSFITEDCIFTMANATDDFTFVRWGLRSIHHDGYESQSKAVRTFLLERLNILLPGGGWEIEKNTGGCPILLKDGKSSGIPLSLAHHGHFVGYSFHLARDQDGCVV